MAPQDPFRTFKHWYHVAKVDLKRIDAAWIRLETEIPNRIPKPIVDRTRKFTAYLACKPGLAFILFFSLLCTRAINWLLNAQFYIEDGREFYAPAFNIGPSTILRDYASYYHVAPRILALIAAALPVRYGPLALELLALAVQAGTAAYLVSKRLEKQFPSSTLRFWLGFMVIAYPYSNELFGNVAHSQWYLAILSIALICSEPAKRAWVWSLDMGAMALNCLTGPFGPVMALIGWSNWRGDKKRFAAAWIALACTLFTIVTIHAPSRFGLHNHSRFSLFERVISNQVVLGPIRGFHYAYSVPYTPFFDIREFATAIFGTAVIVIGVLKAPNLIKALAFLGFFSFTTSLITQASWALIGDPGVGERYFLHIGLVMLFCVYVLSSTARFAAVRWLMRCVMAICALAIVQNWVYDPPFHKFDYPRQISEYERLKKGQTIEIRFPIDRKSDTNSWTMALTKH